MKYAIEIIGCGSRQRYAIKSVTDTGLIIPVNYKAYKTEQAAIDAAHEMGLEISVIGDSYKIVSAIS